MKFLSLVTVLCLSAVLVAAEPKKAPRDMTETEFLADGPKLYSMDDALKVGKLKAKPVFCWVSVGDDKIFAKADARELSDKLSETTIQAAMNGRGTNDYLGARLVLSENSYDPKAQEYYILAKDLGKPGVAEKVLAVARGGK